MSAFNIKVAGGSSVRLPTAGKYCDRDIIVTATGGGGGGDPTLPAGYVRCGYIQFTGEQYIDTGVICNESTRIKSVFTREQSESAYLYGATSDRNTATVSAYIGVSANWRFKDKYVSVSIKQSEELIHTTIHDSTGVDQITSKGKYSDITAFTTPQTLALGAAHTPENSYAGAFFQGKVLSFQIWRYGIEVRHLSPVVSTDGVYRFYDEVSGNFFDSITGTPLYGGNF